ncbi:MAG TPA: DUF4254 domain-containing protein [Elusimicrobiota bacterium]|nr:DUF4254 domain-containing protein [Elusimicrobiota bacterium]
MAETVGSLVDKISIVELKIYHMQEQVVRLDVSEQHRHQCRLRIDVLKQQRNDLERELTELYRDVLSGRRQLKVYRQFKMYNDPAYRTRQK